MSAWSYPPWLADGGSGTLLLALLLSGHLLGDFFFQTRAMVARKGEFRILVGHAAIVATVHLVLLVPFFSTLRIAATLTLGVLAVAAAHGVVDRLKIWWTASHGDGLAPFLTDQAAHVGVLLAAWWGASAAIGPPEPWIGGRWVDAFVASVVILSAFAFNWTGGSAVVSAILDTLSPGLEREEDSGVRGSGRLIGQLERTVTLLLILLGEWVAILLLLTAKSIARFEELKERRFAEYYLVGTLASLLVAFVVGLVLRLLGLPGAPGSG